ncbi:MAG TPA: indole-3-glycerol phosphate synthase TrpC [Pyrinomonadaceae bacterium]|jgi:indole-3-glycerol phosphate synthase
MNAPPDFLRRIIEQKRVRLSRAMNSRPLEELRAAASDVRSEAKPHAFRAALERAGRFHVIAEIKRASPSLGDIRTDISPAALAREYESGGASAISILTEEDHFKGSLPDLREVRAHTSLPLLRKDFIFEEWQVYEAAAARADALLLIVAALEDATLARLLSITEAELGMDALVEVHTAEELRRAAVCGAKVIGVNNRNLHTFEVSLETSVELATHAPQNALLVSESGLRTQADLRRLASLGYRGFLVGETLMRAAHPAEALRALLAETS